MTLLMIVELLVVLVALWVGARYGSLALGAISGIGLAILVFCFHLKPGTPPTDVIYIIIAAVTCAGFCAYQFAGSRGGCHVASGLFAGYRRMDSAGRDAFSIWLFLYP